MGQHWPFDTEIITVEQGQHPWSYRWYESHSNFSAVTQRGGKVEGHWEATSISTTIFMQKLIYKVVLYALIPNKLQDII